MVLKVVLTFDAERFLGLGQGNPRWNRYERFKGFINRKIKRFRYNEEGFEVIRETLEKTKTPSTIMLVGNIFKKPEKSKYIEWGYHSKNHLPLILINDEKLKEQVENKWKLKSITAPMWMIEDERDSKRVFKELKKEKYTHTVYRGKNKGIKHAHFNAVKEPFKKEGITSVWVSNFFEGNWNKKRINEVKRNILKNLDSKGVYLLTSHDFTHKNNKNLLSIIKFLKKLEDEDKIKLMRLKDIK